jgi:hypothetical protein
MKTLRIETIVEKEGELHFTDLSFRKDDRVEAIITLFSKNDEKVRAEALRSFIERAEHSKFRSIGPYPSRDELHER